MRESTVRLPPGRESPSSSETSLTESSQPQSARTPSALTCDIERSSSSRIANIFLLWPFIRKCQRARSSPARSCAVTCVEVSVACTYASIAHAQMFSSAQLFRARRRSTWPRSAPRQRVRPRVPGVVALGRVGRAAQPVALRPVGLDDREGRAAVHPRRRAVERLAAKHGAQAGRARAVAREDEDGDSPRGAGHPHLHHRVHAPVAGEIREHRLRAHEAGVGLQELAHAGGRPRILDDEVLEQRLRLRLRGRGGLRRGGGRGKCQRRREAEEPPGPHRPNRGTRAAWPLWLQEVVLRARPRPPDAQGRGTDAAAGDMDRVPAGAEVGAKLGRVARVDRRGLLAHAVGLRAVGRLERELLGSVGEVGDDEADRPRAEAPRRDGHAVGRDRAGDDDARRRARLVLALLGRPARGGPERDQAGDRDRPGPSACSAHLRGCLRAARAGRRAEPTARTRQFSCSSAISRRRRWRRSQEASSASSYSRPSSSRRSSRYVVQAACSAAGRSLSCRGAVAVTPGLLSGWVRDALYSGSRSHCVGWRACMPSDGERTYVRVDLDRPLATAQFLVVDTETNGLAGDACELTEIGAVLVGGGELHDRWETLVSVREPLSRGIQRFTGISQTMVDEAPPAEAMLPELAEQLRGRVLVAHSAGFDRRVLIQAFARAGIAWPSPPSICTVALARRFHPLARQRRLQPLAESLGIEVGITHRALADAETCARVFCALFARLCANASTIREALALMRPARPKRLRAASTDGGAARVRGARRRRPDLASLSDDPGVYVVRNAEGQVLYVGKSVSVRTRARAHFAPSAAEGAWASQ